MGMHRHAAISRANGSERDRRGGIGNTSKRDGGIGVGIRSAEQFSCRGGVGWLVWRVGCRRGGETVADEFAFSAREREQQRFSPPLRGRENSNASLSRCAGEKLRGTSGRGLTLGSLQRRDGRSGCAVGPLWPSLRSCLLPRSAGERNATLLSSAPRERKAVSAARSFKGRARKKFRTSARCDPNLGRCPSCAVATLEALLFFRRLLFGHANESPTPFRLPCLVPLLFSRRE